MYRGKLFIFILEWGEKMAWEILVTFVCLDARE